MQLDQEQMDKFQLHLYLYFKEDNRCSACGESQWSVDNTIYGLTEFNPDESGDVIDIAVVPLIASTCTNCASIRFFHAQQAGIEFPAELIGPPNDSDDS